ncbi:hypothetical protein VKA52_09540 [Halobacillus sp. HZG1]|uniref:hypothetical protein n=1 Tax=Halobacillus sp. HZG1 TaxID=3111769 RepID=UPI002DBA2CF6|nr:hypothetical protein [Halobacillus sp. HZG1]MEC3883963.1 hypothetical protein [Halobacillus sp. HZG1]
MKKRDVSYTLTEGSEESAHHFARYLADFIQERNRQNLLTRLILPVGPVRPYPILARITNDEEISWKNVHIFNMDEYLDWQGRPIEEDHAYSFKKFMNEFYESLHPSLRPPKDQRHFPDVYNIDDISIQIEQVGGIDLCLGGVGVHGHVAFNEPVISRFHQVTIEEFRNSKTRILSLAPETQVMNSIRTNGGSFDEFPPMAITLGMKDIMNARKIRLYCDGGAWQQEAFYQATCGKEDVRYPVTLLQNHADLKFIATKETARKVINQP